MFLATNIVPPFFGDVSSTREGGARVLLVITGEVPETGEVGV